MTKEIFKRKYIRVSKKTKGYHLEYNFVLPNTKNDFVFGNYFPKDKKELSFKISDAMSYLKNSGVREIYLKSGKKTKLETLPPVDDNLLEEIKSQIKGFNENLIVKKG